MVQCTPHVRSIHSNLSRTFSVCRVLKQNLSMQVTWRRVLFGSGTSVAIRGLEALDKQVLQKQNPRRMLVEIDVYKRIDFVVTKVCWYIGV